MKPTRIIILILSFSLLLTFAFAEKPTAFPDRQKISSQRLAAGCDPATQQVDININNVRATIMNGGDMWWDLKGTAQYEIPKGSGKTSMFAGALWVGGIDAGGQLKLAAIEYRSFGVDYFPGPLDPVTVSISHDECKKFDKIYKVYRQEVQDWVNNGGTPPASVTTWPGNTKDGRVLAPFYDVNGDGIYDYTSGDYPYYDFSGKLDCKTCGDSHYKDLLYGDETFWWVYNDVGNVHGETQGVPIGIEIQAQAFAFTTNDEINNMTFYKYKIINRSSYQLNNTYIGQFADPDLGYAFDDYVGCDVERGLGYCYNGYPVDGHGEAQAYGPNPPAIGIDFFQGPLADPGDGIDNNRNCIVDEPCEDIIMSKFIYYSNGFGTPTTDPENASEYYSYMQGKWKDGSLMTYGGTGHLSGGINCDFMFPGLSDQTYGWGTGGTCQRPAQVQPEWSEYTAHTTPYDRRFLQSAGKFTLKPGAVNYLTDGVVWARPSSGDNLAAIPLLKLADDKAQALFDNCFKVPNGPDAPDLTIRELNQQLIFTISNKSNSNNYMEKYSELDPTIISPSGLHYDQYYHFQGYQVFQLKDPTVSITDIQDPDKARLVFECDIKDSVTTLINYNFDVTLNATVAVLEVSGANRGIFHTFLDTVDQFATGNSTLINHKKYYFTAIAYGFNQYKKYQENTPPTYDTLGHEQNTAAYDGQKHPYFAGRRNIQTYTAIPQMPDPNNYGEALHAGYGDAPQITRIEGQGNGGRALAFIPATVDELMTASNNYRSLHPVYKSGKGPIDIKVYDPVSVPNGQFTFRLSPVAAGQSAIDSSGWVMNGNSNSATTVVNAVTTINNMYEQTIAPWGFSLNVRQGYNPGPLGGDSVGNGFLEATLKYDDPAKPWFAGVPDFDPIFNWIRSGKTFAKQGCQDNNDYLEYNSSYSITGGFDLNQVYEKLLGGLVAPYRLCAYKTCSSSDNSSSPLPAFDNPLNFYNGINTDSKHNDLDSFSLNGGKTYVHNIYTNKMSNLQSVDIVLTSDKSRWTRCVVLEASDDSSVSEGHARKLDLRRHASVDINGNPESDMGRGWFPGYAYSLETGERLNIMFAEDSWLIADHGNDMLWNPTRNFTQPGPFTSTSQFVYGGRHYTYIMNSHYDSCNAYYNYLQAAANLTNFSNGRDTLKAKVFRDAGWVFIPLLNDPALATSIALASPYTANAPQQLLSTDATIRLRVSKAYKTYATAVSPEPAKNNNAPMYSFSTADMAASTNNPNAAQDALALINVVPNPYYAYSEYEVSALDNKVKITNLPSKCTVSIFTLSGILIRRYERSVGADQSLGGITDPATNAPLKYEASLEWDLKNTAGIPIGSGIYLIHVNVAGVGERVIKWFGIMRPLDLNTF